MLVFATHNLLREDNDPLGYLLLRCLRSYLVVDMYAAMEVHTEETIASGRAMLSQFGTLINVRINI